MAQVADSALNPSFALDPFYNPPPILQPSKVLVSSSLLPRLLPIAAGPDP
jgi:hypothetical protein